MSAFVFVVTMAGGLVLLLDAWRYMEIAIASDDTEALAPFAAFCLRITCGLLLFITLGPRWLA